MSLYAIGDLHLSIGGRKPMHIFGSNWLEHHIKIKKNWLEQVKSSDTVMLLGDISWAMSLKEAAADLNFINELTGKKIIIYGNHDYWWSSVSKMNQAYPEICFLKNYFSVYENMAICSCRGWICPNDKCFTEEDEKIYKREYLRLQLSLESAKAAGYNQIIAIMHYPPTNDQKEPSLFTQIYEKYNVKEVYYGHLHGEASFNSSIQGIYNNISYKLVSADYLNFKLYKVR